MTRDAFIAYTPLDALKPVAEDVWVVDGPEIRMSGFGLKLPFPTRMTVIRLPGHRLWLHSPTQPEPALVEAIRRLGRVAWLVAPNRLHYWWLPDWAALIPEASVYLAPGLARSARRALPPAAELGENAPPDWCEYIDQVVVPGAVFTEVDFFHRPSRTLILTDLIENFEPWRARRRLLRRLLQWSGAADPDGKAPIDMRISFWGHKPVLRAAVDRMIAWNPTRILIAHGRWYDRDGVAELRRAFRWVH